ncbi:MAG: pectate lyase [Candidatus Latescibacterota bacterium]
MFWNFRNGIIFALLCIFSLLFSTAIAVPRISTAKSNQSKEKDALAAMKKATEFMMNTVSNHGGFLWKYTADLSEQWGEVPARKTQIWVQDPGTVGVGEMLLDTYRATGDADYLNYAKKVADALIWGQYPSGGWHYLIDFDMPGIRKWYDEVASKCWGWEEYYHYYGNCTYDDDVTSGATRFLLDLYMTTMDPAYRVPLMKALDFILASQYPNGAWPQRYPLSFEYPHDGHGDYTSYYTFNDDVIEGNIVLLLEAFDKLGNEEYQKAALRGMDFVIISQLPAPQAGWGQQFDLNLNSAAARSYEPASIMPGQTVGCIGDLELYYKITGNRKYLRGIPDAIAWLESSVINTDPAKKYTHATFYELKTNKPLYAHRDGTSMENGHYWVDYTFGQLKHYGSIQTIDIQAVKQEFERINALSPEQAMEEYKLQKEAKTEPSAVSMEIVEKLISSMDSRGAWVTEIRIPNYHDTINGPVRITQGIETSTFIRNIRTLTNFIVNQKK